MLLPRKWALGLGLLATAPSLAAAGPLDFLKGKPAPVAESPQRGNQETADDIGQALSQARLVYKDVQIEVRSGTAVIKGQIQDAAQKAQVTRIVSQVPGVKSVENQLTAFDHTPAQQAPRSASAVQQASAVAAHEAASPVQHAAHEGMENRRVQQVNYAPAAPSNQQVAQNIAEALTSSGLSGYDVEVRFKSGIASLIGTVEDKEQVMRAEQAASSVPGVQQVLNRLTVNGKSVDVQQASGPRPPYGPAGYGPAGQPGMPPMGPQAAYAGYPGAAPSPSSGYPGQAAPYGIQPAQGMMPAPGAGMAPPPRGQNVQPAGHHIYNQPHLPQNAWPTYAPYDNSAAISYPEMYDASAWPYIGPYYPYPQVPMGWRKSTLEWDDGYWSLKFDSRTDRWWWFLNPHNWH